MTAPGESGAEAKRAAPDAVEIVGTPPATVAGLSCPHCGGALEVAVGSRVVVCPYCDQPLLAVGALGVRRFAVPVELDAGRARAEVRRWLGAGWNKEPRLEREAEPAETFLCFLPFFRVEADVVGVALGTEERRRTVGSGKNRRTETYEVDVERTVERHFDQTVPAVDVAEWGVVRVDLEGDRLLPFSRDQLERLAMVFPPTASEVAARDGALAAFRRQADPARRLKRVRFSWAETVRERLTVVYYPLWVVRYRYQDRAYQVLIDGEDGHLVYGKAPGNDVYRAGMLVLSQAAGCFVATSLLQLWGVDEGSLAVSGLTLLATVGWGWRIFRHGGVVIEGSGVPREDGGSFVERLLRPFGGGRR